jgi:hypothetical protein
LQIVNLLESKKKKMVSSIIMQSSLIKNWKSLVRFKYTIYLKY